MITVVLEAQIIHKAFILQFSSLDGKVLYNRAHCQQPALVLKVSRNMAFAFFVVFLYPKLAC